MRRASIIFTVIFCVLLLLPAGWEALHCLRSGERFQPVDLLSDTFVRPYARAPFYVGELVADATCGPEVLQNIRFVPTPTGDFYVWKLPDTSRRIADRYVVALDIGGRNPNAH